ncbi:hypothetical protein [Streptomyces sp. NRRL F-7442]|uniref:hypothetical protein n=1 Tax=Streptomyces sp. NRRL F-7442 TaxID=1519498 RepID=UPI000A5FDAA7|nr:hypothetical protein [Streptomyces sp. NRRL F-7442]
MRLSAAQVTNYRSVIDSTEFEVEPDKTIVVGANEAGKTAVLRALQQVNPPADQENGLDALRDYPRSRYTELDRGDKEAGDVPVARATFTLDGDDIAVLHDIDAKVFANARTFELTRYLDNSRTWDLPGISRSVQWKDVSKDAARLKAHVKGRGEEGQQLADELDQLLVRVRDTTPLVGHTATKLDDWLERALPHIDEENKQADAQFDRLRAAARHYTIFKQAWDALASRIPVFVYYSQYFTVRPESIWRTSHSGRPPMTWTRSTTSATCACSISWASPPPSSRRWTASQPPNSRRTAKTRTRWRPTKKPKRHGRPSTTHASTN